MDTCTPSQMGPTMNHTTARPTVLLVDDCIAQRDLYELVLAPEFTVLTASRGSDALTLAAREHPDVVVLDVMMPGLDGWETCTRLKTDPVTADTPVVLLTGSNDVDLSQHAVAVGADAILNKPCSADMLVQRLHVAVSHQQQQR
jgi:CheY-like chemotaxis protein